MRIFSCQTWHLERRIGRGFEVSFRLAPPEPLGGLCLPAPELKAVVQDCLLDLVARELVGRFLIRPDDADCMPGRELTRKLAAGDVAGEGAQTLLQFGLEYVDAHGLTSFSERGIVVAQEGRRSMKGRRPCKRV